MYDKDREVSYSQLKNGLSGIMRVKNEARFIADSITIVQTILWKS